ncbi:MAG: 6,7-dimethyl-8-ribityllumazine synthase [Pirellulaceae bacterium]|nr:MAG: 6,7-dimethyl-8-ribityllumazine synthase [Pirellulaceae bacterium]
MDDYKPIIGVVVSTYNENITARLRQGALETLAAGGYGESRVEVVSVPGAWEIPLAAQRLAQRDDVAGVVCLGAVIRGETSHDEHINRAVSSALMQLMLQFQKPIGFGLLTCHTMEQAIHRAGGNVGNKGVETASAVLSMLGP